MRREINILWIEDNLTSAVKDFQHEVKSIIRSSLYEVHIFNADTLQCIDFKNGECENCSDKLSCKKSILRDHRIDIIFSDNNLGYGIEGVDFLTKYRLNGEFKYYILYSNLDEADIVDKISQRLKQNKKVHLFSNFDFLSMNNWQDRIEDSVTAFLNNRSKMDELRNIYIVENSLIEDWLRQKNYTGDYCAQIANYCGNKNVRSDFISLWHDVRKDRNVLAHGNISFNSGYNKAVGNSGRVVSENDYTEKMQNLKRLTDALKQLDSDFY